MKKLVLASAIALTAAGGAAFAQSTTAPAETAAPTAVEREASRPAQAPAETRSADPNKPGPDKLNGLEVPAMKGEVEGRR